jgi:dTDP-4-dehydrorhamnose reductase
MDCSKLSEQLGLDVPRWQEELVEVLAELKGKAE